VLEPEAVEVAVRYFQEHPDVDMLYGRAYYIDREDKIIGMYKTDEYSFTRLVWDNCVCQPAAFWRRRIADKIGPFDTRLDFAMDHDYWLRIDRAGGKIAHIQDILACSRLYPETKTLSSRTRIFDEIFQISQRHAGYVSLNYFHGLWHHRIWELDDSPYRILRMVPRSYILMGYLHHAVYHRRWPDRLKPRHLAYQVGRLLYRLSNRRLGFLRPLIRKLRSTFYLVSDRAPVFGLFYDNKLGPVFQVYIKRKAPSQRFYIRGIPSVEAELIIKRGAQMVQKRQLCAGREVNIEIDAEPGQRVLMAFSNATRDADDRNTSFLVLGQNLFSEQDVGY
jgi:hypothetical protein